MAENVCCFIGDKNVKITTEFVDKLIKTIYELITKDNVVYFLFGTLGEFEDLCHAIVSDFGREYPRICRAAYKLYDRYFLKQDCFAPTIKTIVKKNVELKVFDLETPPDCIYNMGEQFDETRNMEMINMSQVCVFYFDRENMSNKSKVANGKSNSIKTKNKTAMAYDYGMAKNRKIINMFDLNEK